MQWSRRAAIWLCVSALSWTFAMPALAAGPETPLESYYITLPEGRIGDGEFLRIPADGNGGGNRGVVCSAGRYQLHGSG